MLVSLFSLSLQAKIGKGYDVSYEQTRADEFTLNFQLQDYQLIEIEKNGVVYSTLQFAGNLTTNKQGWAELPYLHAGVQLSPNKNVSLVVNYSNFVEIDVPHQMLPSRGTIYRNQDPNSIPYEIDPESINDNWYPKELALGSEPFIVRDVRGENIYVYPFQYNAVQNKLRIYTDITVTVVENNDEPINPITNLNTVVNREMHDIYTSMFVNYNQNPYRWTNEIGQYGEMLVIYTSRDATAIQPWITWKKQKGVKVHELQVATNTNVKSNIATEYAANPNILYVLVVGDWADIKSDLGTYANAPTDPMMGCVVGGDNYYDIMIGRFSASSANHVTIQGNKVINYEKNPDLAGTWYSNGLGIGSNDGSGIGDDGEIDHVHIDVIKEEKLLPYNYTTVNEAYGSPTATTVANYINAGVGVINYCGHGGHDYWVTSNYSTTNANASTNGSKLPFVFSVACIVGEFHTGSDCLAEAFLRKDGGGAIAVWMSTINQPWTPPMRGQDYANDILTEGFNYSTGSGNGTSTTYGKNMYGAITFNAGALMIAESTATDDWDTYKTWSIFGDPNTQVRTETPKALTITNPSVTPGSYTTQITVAGAPFANALVSIYQAGTGDDQPYSGLTDASGNVTISHPYAGTVKLTVTGYNLATYSQDHVIAVAEPPVCDFTATPTTLTAGSYVNFTDISTNYPSSWTWTLTGGTPSSSTTQNPTVQYNTPGVYSVTLACANGAGSDTETKTNYITVNAVTTPPVADFVASATTINIGESVDFTDLSTNLPTSWAWTFDGAAPGTSTTQNPTGITYNTAGTYTVTLTATNGFGSDTETKTAYITVSAPEPCEASSLSTAYEYISNVTIGTINNTSAASNYTDYTAMSTDVEAGVGSPITVSILNPYSSDQVLIWVDWNRNGVLTDTDEAVFVSATGTGPYSTTITPPAWVTPGPCTMRIRLHDSGSGPNLTPCGTSSYGEVEDYTLTVISSTPAPPVADFSGTPTTVVVGGSVNFTDLSTGIPTSWAWTFTGGSPASSTTQNPTGIVYNTAGTYAVQLTVTNAEGTDSETKAGYITVIEGGSGFSLDFEACVDYSSDFTPWTVVANNTGATYQSSDCDFPGESTAFGYMAFNPADASFTLASTHGGDRCGMAICPSDASQADNWLISEQLTMGTGSSITFWVLSPKPGTWGNESYNVLVSTTTNSLASFTAIATNEEAPATWTEKTYDLSAYDGQTIYVAIQHNSTDMFMFFIDDISINTTFGPSAPTAEFSGTPTTICVGNTVNFTDLSSGADSYSWSFSGGTPSTSTSANPTITYNTPGTYDVSLTVTNTEGSDTETKVGYVIVGAAPTLSTSVTNVNCYGDASGAIDLTVTGGTSPFTYAWTPSGSTQNLTGIAAGTYSVVVNDAAGCTATTSASVSQPATAVSVSATSTQATCGNADGSATATGAGGVSPYTYSWSSGGNTATESNLGAGTYAVMVQDANGCTASTTATVTELGAPTVNVSITNASCNGVCDGSALAVVSGGTSPYTYTWSPTGYTNDGMGHYSDLCAGAYGLTVVDDAGCQVTTSFDITEPSAINVSVSVTDATCFGLADGTATAVVTGGTGSYTYLWNNGATTATITGLTSGVYSVIVTDANDCEGTGSGTVNQPTMITLTGITPVHEDYSGACNGTATASVTGGVPPYVYNWSNGQTTNPATGLCSGDYTVTVTDANGCYVTGTVTITFINNIDENNNESFNVYPNPTSGLVNISCENSDLTSVLVRDITGRLVETVNTTQTITTIDMKKYDKGVYLFELLFEKSSSTIRVVVE